MKQFLICLFLFSSAYAFHDSALEAVWASIQDINNPTLEEYRRLEYYLHHQRDFLNIPRTPAHEVRLSQMRNFMLVGPNGEMPVIEHYSFHITPESERRCILLFASRNGIYEEKARLLLAELEESGYSGHVLLRVGGFPNTQNGGLKICHAPYSFKVAFLQEARTLGYRDVLWMDSAIHPLTNLEMIFSEVRKNGHFFISVGSLQENAPGHRPEAAATMNVPVGLYPLIPHISSSLLGFDLENERSVRLLEAWYQETGRVYSSISWFPEELSLSVMAWRTRAKPSFPFHTIVCLEEELDWVPKERPMLQGYLDSRR
ncbi:MAG TPA: hypothetical protein VLF94_04900 [Chlamydiales bacterium]|nr:hypothetical protein [Chlamydiales bacterium]